MKDTIGRWLVVFLTLFPSPLLFSSNFHEHLFSLPFPENIASQHEAIFALPEEQQHLSIIFPDHFLTERDLRKKLHLRWSKKETQGITLDTTLSALCHTLPGDPKDNLRQLLAFAASTKKCEKLKLFDYETSETLRKNLLLALPKENFLKIYEAYFNEEPLANRTVISATVTRRFFDRAQHQKYHALIRLAAQYQTQLIYRVSLQRTQFLKKGLALSKEVLELLEGDHIGGIDVVGSLLEATYSYPYTKQEMQTRLVELFEYIHKNHLIVVFHLFEDQSDDAFYAALQETLKNWNKPLCIEVGHVAHITPEWIDLFAANPALHPLFHINVASNQLLHNIPLSHLKKIGHSLLKKGFPVVLGSDGRGILPGSSYLEQKELLALPISRFSLLSLRDTLFSSRKCNTKKWTESSEPVY